MNLLTKSATIFILTSVMILLSYCSSDDPPENPVNYPQLYLNEIMPDNETVLADNEGEHDDWIEIYNPTDEDVNLAGWYISDDFKNLMQYRFPYNNASATTIPAQGYVIIWADEQPGQGALHLNFRLSSTGESVFLSGNGMDIIDRVTYGEGTDIGSPSTDQSAGRIEDGASTWIIFSNPTPGAANIELPPEINIRINEFMAGNDSFIADDFGEYDDWIELYNPGAASVDVGGWYITDDSLAISKWQIPADASSQTTIPPGNFLLIWCDEQPEQGPLHVGIKLNVEGESIGLSADGQQYIDFIRFGPGAPVPAPPPDQSAGRIENGGLLWMVYQSGSATPPTPGASNSGSRLH